MEKIRRLFAYFLPLLLLTVITGQAHASLKAVGPTDAVSTLPTWYQDNNNLALQLCLDQNGFCLLGPPFDPAVPPVSTITTTPGTINDANFPGESFYYSAASILPIEGGELANLAFVMEAAFLSGVAPDGGITFLRTDLQKMRNLTPNSTYRVTHPYGTFTFDTDAIGDTTGGGGVAIRLEDGPAVPAQWLPPGMKAATNTGIGPFLTRKTGGLIFDAASGNTYIGDGATEVEVVGSPTGNNFYRIERILTNGVPVTPVPGVSSWEKITFVLNGKVFTGPIPSDLTVSATYARDASSAQVDIFATALSGAVLTISGTGITTTQLTPDTPANGKYFLHIPLGTSPLPTNLLMTNSLDLQATPPHPVTLVDEVNITQAFYNTVARTLTIKAASRDKISPPTLTVPAFAAPNTLDATGTVVLTLPAGAIPPASIQVVSSAGGSATAPVSVATLPAPPVAFDDSATTIKGAAVSVSVLTNDTTTATLDPTSVAIVAVPASGASTLAAANGAVIYTPTATFTGTETFTYTVRDTFGQLSNTATVTVTVHEPPVAVNDAATTSVNALASINVIANDTAFSSSINSTTVNIVSPATCGTTNVLTTGIVEFTAPATPGTCSFSYVVSDSFVPPATSNVATVTVTVVSDTPATGLTAFYNLPSPQLSGTVVSFGAVASGGSGIYEYQYWLKDTTGAYTLVKPYSAPSTWDWDTTGLPTAGTYQIAVQARNAGSIVSFDQERVINYSLNAPSGPGVAVSLSPNIPSPQTVGVPIFFAANVTGGTGTYEYQFWLKDTTGVYTLVQPYGLNSTYKWDTAGALPGGYSVAVQTRVVGSLASFDAETIYDYLINAVPTPANAVIISTNVPSPQSAGAQVFVTGTASGGSGSYEYQFWLKDTSGVYTLVQSFSAGSIWQWDTTGLASGTYTFSVQARSAGSANIVDVENLADFVIP